MVHSTPYIFHKFTNNVISFVTEASNDDIYLTRSENNNFFPSLNWGFSLSNLGKKSTFCDLEHFLISVFKTGKKTPPCPHTWLHFSHDWSEGKLQLSPWSVPVSERTVPCGDHPAELVCLWFYPDIYLGSLSNTNSCIWPTWLWLSQHLQMSGNQKMNLPQPVIMKIYFLNVVNKNYYNTNVL